MGNATPIATHAARSIPERLQDIGRLLVMAPNWLGDAVMALPAIADLRRTVPECVLSIAARPAVAPLFTMVPGVDAIVALDARRTISRDEDGISGGRFDAAVLLPNSLRAALIVWRAGVPERWGYRTAFRSPLLTLAPLPPSEVHQAVYYQRLTAAIGAPSGPLVPTLVASADHRRAGGDLLAAAGWDRKRPLVALAPGAAYGGAKRWTAASFAKLASALHQDGLLPVLVGGTGDREAGAEVVAASDPGVRVVNLIGQTDLPTLAGVFVSCRSVVSNDSGAMHVASALGVPVTALFGPTNEEATRPLGAGRSTVLTHAVWCRPCMLRECPLEHRCMTGIDVDAALDAVRSSM